jgi:hypothetical protein
VTTAAGTAAAVIVGAAQAAASIRALGTEAACREALWVSRVLLGSLLGFLMAEVFIRMMMRSRRGMRKRQMMTVRGFRMCSFSRCSTSYQRTSQSCCWDLEEVTGICGSSRDSKGVVMESRGSSSMLVEMESGLKLNKRLWGVGV